MWQSGSRGDYQAAADCGRHSCRAITRCRAPRSPPPASTVGPQRAEHERPPIPWRSSTSGAPRRPRDEYHPIPPELVTLLRAQIKRHGTTLDGRIFQTAKSLADLVSLIAVHDPDRNALRAECWSAGMPFACADSPAGQQSGRQSGSGVVASVSLRGVSQAGCSCGAQHDRVARSGVAQNRFGGGLSTEAFRFHRQRT